MDLIRHQRPQIVITRSLLVLTHVLMNVCVTYKTTTSHVTTNAVLLRCIGAKTDIL